MPIASEVRKQFLDFFESKLHRIVESAPIVVKDDPTLMFTNAGMNQFKDYFLGNKIATDKRVANTQKCLRVSGKHNDLEEVGVDTYHHTMFEMLGNWSFGDYFKEEAIAWAWELLTSVYKLDTDRLYVSIFEGNEADGLEADEQSAAIWAKYIAKDRILRFGKKDNFWEMGETGPCGPCSEIHMDLRPDTERAQKDGALLVNRDHDQVIELWNLVFIQFNRKADGSLENLPNKHVDTGMGLERILRAVNGKSSNYDTDLFTQTIAELEKVSGKKYGRDKQMDIAFRVIADHLRAVAFTIADGQLPGNEKAGHVVRRILRRAIRYGYSFLGMDKPFLAGPLKVLCDQFADVFPELSSQEDFIARVVRQEEQSFLQTLGVGLKLFDQLVAKGAREIDGKTAFELYDTYGFPKDLTQLLARERGMAVDMEAYERELQAQKSRSKADAKKVSGDWQVLIQDEKEEFVGYDYLDLEVKLTRYRAIEVKNKKQYQLVFNISPFYAESGGQVGDTGLLTGISNGESIRILDTRKENNLIIQFADKLPELMTQPFRAEVDAEKRNRTAENHSATHLVHAALRQVLGEHVHQKGSLVNEEYLRFDFSHFEKTKQDEIDRIEAIVNQKIRAAIPLTEERNVPFNEAISKGALALFGEKYGDVVRVITFDPDYSVELCGGTHVSNTARIGMFKIIHETSVAAGVRRIEAITGERCRQYINQKLKDLQEISNLLGGQQDPVKSVDLLLQTQDEMRRKIREMEEQQTSGLKDKLKNAIKHKSGFNVILEEVHVESADQVKNLAYQLRNEIENLFCAIFANVSGKPNITVIVSDELVSAKGLNAGKLVSEWAKAIKGGGGGQPFFAQAGGADIAGLSGARAMAESFLNEVK